MRTPRGRVAADALLAEVVQRELTMRERDGDLAATLKPLADALAIAKRLHAKGQQPDLDFIESAKQALMCWYNGNLPRYGRGRSITLPSGSLEGHLTGKWKVTVTGDPAEVIAAVANRNPDGIKVEVTLDIATISANPETYAGIPGLAFVMNDTLRITSALLDPATAPKQSRLIGIYRRYTNPRRKPRPHSVD